MDQYLDREEARLSAVFTTGTATNTELIPTQPLQIQDLPLAEEEENREIQEEERRELEEENLNEEESPLLDAPIDEDDYFRGPSFIGNTPLGDNNIQSNTLFPSQSPSQQGFYGDKNTTPKSISPILRSSIPIVKLKTLSKRNPPPSKKRTNKFEGMDWEELNTILHGLYPIKQAGVLCLDNFDLQSATADVELLTEIDQKNIEDLFLIKNWIKKITYAISLTPYSDEETDEF